MVSDLTITLVVIFICATVIYVLGRKAFNSKDVETIDPERQEDHGPTQDEVDLWVDVFKITLKKDQSIHHAASQADMAVYQYNMRYGEEADDDA